MKGLTLTQPWASLVANGAKTIETRSWSTSYRGPVAIHAAKGTGPGGKAAFRERCLSEPFFSALGGTWRDSLTAFYHDFGAPRAYGTDGTVLETSFELTLPLGAIVATATLAHCLPIFGFDDELRGPTARFGGWPEDEDPEVEECLAREGWWLDMGIPTMHPNQAPFGHFDYGRFAWFLEDVRPLAEPVACKGALGLWPIRFELPRSA
jgi:activating signal cointegrator 1